MSGSTVRLQGRQSAGPFLSNAQGEQLLGFPAEIDDEALDRFFILSRADWAKARKRRGIGGNRLGWRCGCAGCVRWGFALMT
ncbi:MAG: hypothetical protein JO364_16575 [Pseudonocardiales bacterium]|nr:hypothetical protein [Pseudonocardiales bacterium]MBV9031879.1 hypothetical protein [Pseudonocardiales bacterium]